MALEALSAVDSNEKTFHSPQETSYWNGREIQFSNSDFRLAHLGNLQVHTVFFHEINSRLALCAREVSVKTSEPKSSDKGAKSEPKSASEPKQPESKQQEPKHSVSAKGTVSKDSQGREKGKMSGKYNYSHKNENGSSVDVHVEASASTDQSDTTKDIISGEINAGVTLRF